MRIVFVGASRFSTHTARILLQASHDVVVIEREHEKVETLTSELGCGVIQGDGSKPIILREADPSASDFLFCVTDNDQTNIISSLVGRSLGFKHVVTRVDDPEFEHICVELGLENTIIPSQTISRFLAAMVQGETSVSISAMIKNNAALFSYVVREEDAMPVSMMELPEGCRLIILYRGDKFFFVEEKTELKKGDEVVVLCHSDHLEQLRKRWIHTKSENEPD